MTGQSLNIHICRPPAAAVQVLIWTPFFTQEPLYCHTATVLGSYGIVPLTFGHPCVCELIIPLTKTIDQHHPQHRIPK